MLQTLDTPEEVRRAREDADRARRLAFWISDDISRIMLMTFATEREKVALQLELKRSN